MPRNTILYKLLILILLTFVMQSQALSQNRLELSLEEVIKYAITHNKNMENASISMQEARAAYKAALAQGLPQVEAKLDYQNFFNSSASLGPMVFTFNPTSNLNLSVGQLVFSGSYLVGLQMSKIYEEITAVSYKKTDADIKTQVMNSYFLILVSKSSLEILRQNVNDLEDVISKTSALVQVEILDETDLGQIQLQKNMLENAVRSSERRLEMAYNLLRVQLGVDAATELALSETLSEIIGKSNVEKSMITAFNINQNFDYQLLLLQKDIAEKQVNMEKSKALPTVAGFYNYTEKIKKSEMDFAPKHVIGFNVSIPIFSSGVRHHNHEQAKLKLQTASNQISIVAAQLSVQEKQLRFNLKNAIEQYEMQQENIALARQIYDKITQKYKQGILSGLDMTTANSNLLQAENEHIIAIMQLLEAKTALDKLLNQL